MKILGGIILCLILIIIGGIIYMYSGTYDVSVRNQDKGLARWVLETTMENSVEHYAKNINVPSLDDTTMILKGFVHYSRMCGCHGSPGRESSKSFNPEPPELYKTADEWKPNELFWMIKNGIKMSAMPAFADRINDSEIWNTVAFLKILPKVTTEEYKAFGDRAKAAGLAERRER
jgi:mono/diheme cytochrome c family protein